jgi:hypothetical protein
MQVYHCMPANLNKRIAVKPLHEIGQRIVSGEFFPHGVNPRPPVPSQDRCDFVTSKQPYPVTVDVSNLEQLIGRSSETYFIRLFIFCFVGSSSMITARIRIHMGCVLIKD